MIHHPDPDVDLDQFFTFFNSSLWTFYTIYCNSPESDTAALLWSLRSPGTSAVSTVVFDRHSAGLLYDAERDLLAIAKFLVFCATDDSNIKHKIRSF